MSSTVGQTVPNRPLSEEDDEEVAVHELRAEAVVLAVKMRTSVAPGHPRWTGRSVQRPDNGTESRDEVGRHHYRRTIVLDCRSKERKPRRRSQKSKTWRKPSTNSRAARSSRCQEARPPPAIRARMVGCGERRPCRGEPRRAVVPGEPGLPDWAGPCSL